MNSTIAYDNGESLYGYLTDLVSEEERTENFFRGLWFIENFQYIRKFIDDLLYHFDNLEPVQCFDYMSQDDYLNSFRGLSFNYDNNIYADLKQYVEEYPDDIVESINIENGCILIRFNERGYCEDDCK